MVDFHGIYCTLKSPKILCNNTTIICNKRVASPYLINKASVKIDFKRSYQAIM